MPNYQSLDLAYPSRYTVPREQIGGLDPTTPAFGVPQGGNWTGSAQGRINPADEFGGAQVASDVPAWNAMNGMYINSRTKQPWTGKLNNGMYVRAGRPAQDPSTVAQPAINPNDVNQRYKAVSVPKQPEVAGAASDLLTTFKKQADASLQDFSKYLSDFKANLGTAQGAAKQAENITPTAIALAKQQQDYAGSLDRSAQDLAALNARTATAETGAVTEAKDLLPSYDAAANAIADRQMQGVYQNLSRYKMGTGTPTSAGSDESRILAQAASDVALPLEREKINRRYDIISGLELPVTRDIASRETSRIAQFDPLVAGQIFNSGQATVKDIENLRQQVRNMSYEDAVRFMQAAQIPVAIQQQILQGQISNLGQISGIESQANYQGLQDVLGANLTPAQYYSQANPEFPNLSRYSPGGGPAGLSPGLSAPNAPVQVGGGGGGGGNASFDASGNPTTTQYGNQYRPTWGGGLTYDPRSGRWQAPSRYNLDPGGELNVHPGTMANAYYDPRLGKIVDRTSGTFVAGGIH